MRMLAKRDYAYSYDAGPQAPGGPVNAFKWRMKGRSYHRWRSRRGDKESRRFLRVLRSTDQYDRKVCANASRRSKTRVLKSKQRKRARCLVQQGVCTMKTEADFRARVRAGEWPSHMGHGAHDGRYAYEQVCVEWHDDEVETYAFSSTEDRPLDGYGGRSAFALANRILSDRAMGFDVSSPVLK